jgi:hypothetical protein
MTRITTLLLLVMFWSGTAFAVVYQCRDKDGNLFLTNNRNKFPPGCVQVGEPIGEERAPSPPAASPPAAPGSRPEMLDRGRPALPPSFQTPAGTPETGGAVPGPSGKQPPQEEQAVERTDEVPSVSGQPDQPSVVTPVQGGKMPAGEEAGATKEGELERWRAQARALAGSYDALHKAAGSQIEKAAQLEQLENRIQLFLERLAASKLTPEERAEVEAELPPE